MPSWLSLSARGLLTGIAAAPGSLAFTVTVTDANNVNNGAMGTFAIAVFVPSPPTFVTASTLAPGTVGVPYAQRFIATGGTGLYTFSGTGLPSPFTVNGSGLLSGTPVAPASNSFSITVLDTATGLTATQMFTLPIYAALTITSAAQLPTAAAGQPYSAQVNASGGLAPYRWTGIGLPAWLSLSQTGLLTGVPPAAGNINFTVSIADSLGHTVNQAFSIPVSASLVITSSNALPSATVNTPYSASLTASGGTGPYMWKGTGLPSWLSLSSSGVLTGTPAVAGSFTSLGPSPTLPR